MENIPDTVTTVDLDPNEEVELRKARMYIVNGAVNAERFSAIMEAKPKCTGFTSRHLSSIKQSESRALDELQKNKPQQYSVVKNLLEKIGSKPKITWDEITHSIPKKESGQFKAAVGAWAATFQEKINATLGTQSRDTAQRKAKHPSESGFEALMEHHQQVGFVALILGDLKAIDPVIGDASCEMRCPFLLDLHDAVHRQLKEKNSLNSARKLASEFLDLHKGAEYEKNARERKDIKATSANLLSEIDALKKVVLACFKDAVEYLGLCVSMTRSCKWRFDEFGTPYHFRDSTTFYCVASEKDKFIDYKPKLKARLASLSCAYMKQMARRLEARAGSNANQQSTSKDEQTIESMLVKVFSTCDAKKTRDGFDIELLPIYSAFRAIMMNEFAAQRPINLIVRRIRKAGASYGLDDARTLCYVPKDSSYVYSDAPVDKERPCFTIDSFSVVTDECPNYCEDDAKPLFGNDTSEYFKCLAAADLSTLIQIYSAGHPPFAGDSTVPGTDPLVYQQNLHQQCRLRPDSEPSMTILNRTSSGGQFAMESLNDTHTNLLIENMRCRDIAEKYHLHEAQQVRKEGNKVTRIDRAVCFAPEHVKVMSFNQALEECKKLKEDTHGKTFPRVFELKD